MSQLTVHVTTCPDTKSHYYYIYNTLNTVMYNQMFNMNIISLPCTHNYFYVTPPYPYLLTVPRLHTRPHTRPPPVNHQRRRRRPLQEDQTQRQTHGDDQQVCYSRDCEGDAGWLARTLLSVSLLVPIPVLRCILIVMLYS